MESLIILAITFVLLWVLLVLPRRRWQQAHRRMVAELAPGDEVVTSAGIYGTITELEDDVVHVRVAEGVVVRVARMAIGHRAEDGARPGTAAGTGVDHDVAGELSGELDAPPDGSED